MPDGALIIKEMVSKPSAKRLAFIRTWTYVANRGKWLDDAEGWREETRDVEDRRQAFRKSISEDVVLTDSKGRRRTVQLVDVSTTGAQILDMTDAEVGEAVVLDLEDGTMISGRIVRQTGSGSGIEFGEALADDHALLAA